MTERRGLRGSFFAVILGLVATTLLSLGTDAVLRLLKVYPPAGQTMTGTKLYALALAYRCLYAVFGSYLAARLAPGRPMRHAIVLGLVGLVLSLSGALGALLDGGSGPLWYPFALVLTALPSAWLGGLLVRPSGGRQLPS